MAIYFRKKHKHRLKGFPDKMLFPILSGRQMVQTSPTSKGSATCHMSHNGANRFVFSEKISHVTHINPTWTWRLFQDVWSPNFGEQTKDLEGLINPEYIFISTTQNINKQLNCNKCYRRIAQ